MLKRTSINPIDIPGELIKVFPDKLTKALTQILNAFQLLHFTHRYGKQDMYQTGYCKF